MLEYQFEQSARRLKHVYETAMKESQEPGMDYNKYVFHKLHKMPQVGRDPRERLLALCGGLLPGSWIILITLM